MVQLLWWTPMTKMSLSRGEHYFPVRMQIMSFPCICSVFPSITSPVVQSVKLSGQWKQKWIHFGFVFCGGLWTHLPDGCGYICCLPFGKCVWEFIHLFETEKKKKSLPFLLLTLGFPKVSCLLFCHPFFYWCLHFTDCLQCCCLHVIA